MKPRAFTPKTHVNRQDHMPNRKIGFNPQDRFMLALGNTLVVVTATTARSSAPTS